MIQPLTQTADYWGANFSLTDTDIEQIYNHFIEVEKPQTAADITKGIIAYRVALELNNVKKRLSGRRIYQPQNSYEENDELVFPALKFAYGTVTAVRNGFNPQDGDFKVLTVNINDKTKEFATALQTDHLAQSSSSGVA